MSFETNVTDSWTKTGSATVAQDSDVSTDVYSGSYSAKVTGTGSWTYSSNSVPIENGIYYTVSGYVKSNANLTVTLIGRDSSNNIVDSSNVNSLGTVTSWSRFSSTFLVDANNTTTVKYEVKFSGGSGAFYIDSVQFEKGVAPSDYFDGSLPSEFGAVWESTANNSYTQLYVGKPYKIPRLALTLDSNLPPNTFWRLLTYTGLEYTNLTV